MKTGISTACLYPLETEKSLKRLLESGFRTFEVFFNSDREITADFVHTLKAQLQDYHACIYSCHFFTSGFEPFLFFGAYSRRFQDGLELYRRYCATFAQTGAKVAVFHGDRIDSELPIEEYCERFYILSQAAAAEGMILAQENVSRCKSAHVATIKQMREYLGKNISFVFDLKQAVRAKENPFDMLAAMEGSIMNVHLSDHTPQRDCLLPGDGSMDYGKLLNHLRLQGYDGPLTIEVYRSDFDHPDELRQTRLLMEAILEKQESSLL